MDVRLCHAIAERRLLMFAYRGVVRVAEPHLYGENSAGHEAVSAWLRSGWSRLDPEGGWRMFLWDEASDLTVLPEQFEQRADFNPEDPHFVRVFCRVGEVPRTDAGPQGGPEPAP